MSNNSRHTGDAGMLGSELRKQVNREEIDYLTLKSLLQHYARPRDKLRQYLRHKVLIRVKKGLYVFGKQYAQKGYSKETLANLIYGPSAISLIYALSFYGLIPERVNIVSSITNKRNKSFHTPVGTFTYRYLHPMKYSIGITQVMLDEFHPILIATPEKALADQLMLATAGNLLTEKNLEQHLYENLRLEEAYVKKLKIVLLKNIAQIYQNPNTHLLLEHVNKLRRR